MSAETPPSIDDLITAFQQLKGADVGRGPYHPTAAQPACADEITRFLRTFPFLSNYPDYVRFLQHYAGATLEHFLLEQNTHHTVFLLGFAPESWHIYDEMTDADLIDANGFYIFAITLVEDPTHLVEHAYSFAATNQHPPGVYRSVNQPHADLEYPPVYQRHCDYFWEFVAEIIQKEGCLS